MFQGILYTLMGSLNFQGLIPHASIPLFQIKSRHSFSTLIKLFQIIESLAIIISVRESQDDLSVQFQQWTLMVSGQGEGGSNWTVETFTRLYAETYIYAFNNANNEIQCYNIVYYSPIRFKIMISVGSSIFYTIFSFSFLNTITNMFIE